MGVHRRERQTKRVAPVAVEDESFEEFIAEEDHPDEVVRDEPEFDTYSDDEPEYPEAAEESAVHVVSDTEAEEGEKSPE